VVHARGKSGTSARYRCSGDYLADGGHYCIGFAGAPVDRRLGEEMLRVLSPLGIQASLKAFERVNAQQDDRHHALRRQIEQLEFEVARAFEQYDHADPRNRLVASELERRWNDKLTELERVRAQMTELDGQRKPVTAEERNALRAFGARFADVWNHAACSMNLKKQIVRTVIEEILVDENPPSKLSFIVHWKGGCHTAFEMEKPNPKAIHRTAASDVDIVRKMAPRYGDNQIAQVLNRLGHRTGKGKPWSETAVKSVRKNHKIAGRARSIVDPDVLTLQAAAKYTETSDTTIKKLVDAGIVPMRQVVPFAPWEIQRAELDSERVRAILARLKRTGRLELGDTSENQRELFQ